MKAEWILKHEMTRFFENKFELRARIRADLFKDRILKACFSKTLEDVFRDDEIKFAIKQHWIVKDQINDGVVVKNIYAWELEECKYQPVWYKRKFQEAKNWFANLI